MLHAARRRRRRGSRSCGTRTPSRSCSRTAASTRPTTCSPRRPSAPRSPARRSSARECCRATPNWISEFPDNVRLESDDDPMDPQAPHISVTLNSFSRPVLHFQLAAARRPAPDRGLRRPPEVQAARGALQRELVPRRRGRLQAPRHRARVRHLHDPAYGGGGRAAGAPHRRHEEHDDAGARAGRPQRRAAQQHHQHPHRAARLPRRGLARRRGQRALHRADAAGVPRQPRRLLHPRPRGPARVARPHPAERAVLRQQPETACGSSTGW